MVRRKDVILYAYTKTNIIFKFHPSFINMRIYQQSTVDNPYLNDELAQI